MEYAINIDVASPYTVHVGTFLLEEAGAIARESCGGAQALVITDSTVGPLFGQPVRQSLETQGYTVHMEMVAPGESSKGGAVYLDLLEKAAELELARTDIVVALGGGVVGDLAGFLAASYMRGIPYIQVPTTLLAMVDASIGGKTAINLAAGKNLAGAFWQPRAVIADVGCLATLEDAQFADGCAEVIKHAVIADAELFGELEATPLTPGLLKSDLARAAYLIARNVDIKRAVVSADERETSLRKLLNFGHSIGHGIEAASGYELGHGRCVGVGMLAIASASVTAGVCPADVPDRIAALLRAHGLPLNVDVDTQAVYEAALHDKKRASDSIDLVVPRSIGAAAISHAPLDEFKRILEVGLACTEAYAREEKETSSPEEDAC